MSDAVFIAFAAVALVVFIAGDGILERRREHRNPHIDRPTWHTRHPR